MTRIKKAIPTLEYSFAGIKTVSFSYNIPDDLPQSQEDFQINYQISPALGVNIEEKLIILNVKILGIIIMVDNEKNDEILKAEIRIAFRTEQIQLIFDTKKNPESPDFVRENSRGFISSLIGIAIGTTRGMLIEKLAGTPYMNKYLPPMNPNIFLRDATE